MALHHLMSPSLTKVKGISWHPSIQDSKDALLSVVRRLTDMKEKIRERKNHCRIKQLTFHPMIFEVETGNNFVVVFNDIQYEFESVVHAIDTAFKMFDFFEIPYPHECKNVWTFLQSFFYKTNINEKLCHKGKILLEQLSRGD